MTSGRTATLGEAMTKSNFPNRLAVTRAKRERVREHDAPDLRTLLHRITIQAGRLTAATLNYGLRPNLFQRTELQDRLLDLADTCGMMFDYLDKDHR